MTEFDPHNHQDLQIKLYPELDRKLKSTPWNSGASEAHGLLTGLACRGITAGEINNKMYLLKISNTENAEHVALIEGMFDLILRDLQSNELAFSILLPADQVGTIKKTEEISNWCEGYLQGLCYDGKPSICTNNATVCELFQDIFDIASVALEFVEDNEAEQKALFELEEYLRVGIRLIYDEVVNATADVDATRLASALTSESH